jgi:hypothetical protein
LYGIAEQQEHLSFFVGLYDVKNKKRKAIIFYPGDRSTKWYLQGNLLIFKYMPLEVDF